MTQTNSETTTIDIVERIIRTFEEFETRIEQLQKTIDDSNAKLRIIADSLGLKNAWMQIPLK